MGELGEYLKLLNTFYDAFLADMYRSGEDYDVEAGQATSGSTLPEIVGNTFDDLFYDRPDVLVGLSQDATRYLAMSPKDGEDAAEIVRIAHSSPMEIVLSAVTVALSFAVILSGGKIEMPGLKVALPPVGTGILALRRALGYAVGNPPSRHQAGALTEEQLTKNARCASKGCAFLAPRNTCRSRAHSPVCGYL